MSSQVRSWFSPQTQLRPNRLYLQFFSREPQFASALCRTIPGSNRFGGDLQSCLDIWSRAKKIEKNGQSTEPPTG